MKSEIMAIGSHMDPQKFVILFEPVLPVKDFVVVLLPFTYTAVDYFGPWIIKEGRREIKCWGVVFSCLACRAVHLETDSLLDTSSFINASSHKGTNSFIDV
jgi:hypothetical protein